MELQKSNETSQAPVADSSAQSTPLQNVSESFRKFGAPNQRKDTHTISVRDAAKMFEAAGVPRTERSIVNWCWPNRQGLARLDAYFDPNERKYLITQASIDLAIQEELSKTPAGTVPQRSERTLPNASESQPSSEKDSEPSSKRVTELEKQILDLNITNRAKDLYIDQLRKERQAFADERQGYVEQLISANHQIGQLETRLLQLQAPKEPPPASLESDVPPQSAVG